MNRRNILIALPLAAGLLNWPQSVIAIDSARAERLINALLQDINDVVYSSSSEASKTAEFKDIFRRYSDVSYIAAYVMGVEARRATKTQKAAFSQAFQSYIAKKYGKRFHEFTDGRLEVKDVRAVKRWYEVDTLAHLPNSQPLEITFFVSDRTGEDLFFNMFVGGINLLLNERAEVGALIDKNRGDIDAMIREIENLS
ncbi:MAG: ABC transporter substrate-binding protein [Aestuariivita sp.]|nr:ABC transporter substrate-binding protein [Aestuariivita sp.]MCY4203290.1 ABC transporter substrate-binding protein [Aestuariivita sp.]MCY4287183.1 ABC transporter substrate-binding protein [Aestuariivita sp.]MCY4347509.1 ABC transporter substrate-binding protein [Aestuariivita sp.]